MPAQRSGQGDCCHRADGRTATEGSGEHTQRMTLFTRYDGLEHQYREQRAKRIDDDAFPAQRVGDLGVRAQGAQHRHDHGRAGDASQCAKQQRDLPCQPGDVVCACCQHQQGSDCSVADQPAHAAANFTQLVEAQGQAALEQDQGYRQ